MRRYWKYVYPCYLWTIIMSMVGLFLAHFVYKARLWQWRDGVLTCVAEMTQKGTRIWGQPNAQTLGWVQIYDTEQNREYPDLRVHENVHVVQAFVGGIVGFTIIPILFAALGWSPLIGLLLGGFIGGLGFAALYGILFLYLYIRQGGGDWVTAYRNNPFEDQAYKLQDKYLAKPDTRPWGS